MSDAPTLLRQHGLQVTPQRLAVLAAVQGSPHATADIVVHDVRHTIGSISRQSVYDSLAPCLTAANDEGFVIDEAEVVYWGQCPTCSPEHTTSHT